MRSEDIQNEIERTRGEMADTLQAIERKLSPRQLMDQAVDTMRDIASDYSRVGQAVRDNPIPLALIGLGIGWLAVSNMRSGGAMAGESDVDTGIAGSAWGSPPGMGDFGAGAGAPSSGYGAEGAEGLKQRASDVAGQAKARLSETASSARARVSEWSSSARRQAGQAADATLETYQEHPLTMGVVAMLLGAAIGAMIPRSSVERRVLGGSDIAQRARDAIRQTAEQVKQTGQEAMGAVSERIEESLGSGSSPSSSSPSSLTH
ncbi:MAG: DUF3618 domain-containing protein [Actinomycetota bacterium]